MINPSRPPESGDSDDELMRLTREGDHHAFELLVRRHESTVLRLSAKYLGTAALAQDAAQNTFVELFRYTERYEPQGKLRALICRIAVNQCRMLLRRRSSERRLLTTLAKQPREEPAELAEQDLPQEDSRRVNEALAHLRPKLAEVLALRYGGGLSHEEIAEALGLPIGTVKSRIAAGLEKLRGALRRG